MRAPLVVATAWLTIGIVAGLQRPVPPGDGPLFVVVALGAAVLALFIRLARPGAHAIRPLLFLLTTAGVLLGFTVRSQSDRSCLRWIPDDRSITLHGRVAQVGRRSGTGSRPLKLEVDSVRAGVEWSGCRTSLNSRWDGDLELSTGTRVEAHGRWWSPPGARSTLGRPGAFMVDSLALQALPEGSDDAPSGIAGMRLAGIGGVADRIREAGVRRIENVFTRHSALVASLLLARRDGLDRDVRDRYARAGLSHLLAISGLHVGLIAGILLLLTGTARLAKSRAAAVAAFGTVLYVLLLGAPDSAARAALQIVLVLTARALQRPSRNEAAIAAAALVLLAADPAAITRAGFQLSFAGVGGILVLRQPLLDRMRGLSRRKLLGRSAGRWLADGLATSLAATLMTAPIVAWHFGRVAPVGIVANLAAIPLLGMTVPALALALIVGGIWLPAGQFIAGGGELLLDALDRIATLAAAAPYGTVAVRPGSAFVITGAVVLGFLASRRLGRVRGPIRGAVWSAVAVAVLLVAPIRPAGDRVEIHVIDVGQGDAIGIRSPGGRWLLVDAGLARNDYDAGESRVVPYLAGRGVRRLDGLIITHPDGDHMGGAGAVLRSLRPRWAGGPGVVAAKGQYLDLLALARSRGVPWLAVRQGMELEIDGMSVSVLYPAERDVDVEDANDASVVLLVSYGEFSALLTGDAPSSVEEALIRRLGRRLDADVLKVGHHGSRTSTSAGLLSATRATIALISAGRGNRYGHPDSGVLARLRQGSIQVYRTDRHGTVVVRSGARGVVDVRTERE